MTIISNTLWVSPIFPPAERLRQRLDQEAETYLDIANTCSVAMLKNGKVHLTALDTGHIPLDVDVFPMDNSGTKKKTSATPTRDTLVTPRLQHILAWKAGVWKWNSGQAASIARKDSPITCSG